ncbi:MAG: long-chain fatty acid--CoA ligase, partial [Ignavibacteriaceae bacterium]|nr:long-chain fatty acid--CoA ligase [Ignavibacteriaceae bacterium]
CSTIPELYQFLTEEYKPTADAFILHRKVEGKYKGITYKELKEETNSFAYGLSSLGVGKGDKVAIISENRPEWVYSDFAILELSAIDVPLFPSLTADSIEFILNNSESKGVIISNKFQLNKIRKIIDKCKHIKFIVVLNENDFDAEVKNLYTFKQVQELGSKHMVSHPNLLEESIKQIDENDICTLIYTSGTTGEPKGVILTHKNIMSNVNSTLEIYPITTDDVFLSFLPLCHSFERMAGYYSAFAAGAPVYYAESIETVAANLIEVKPTIMTSVPRLFERIYSKIIKNVESQPEKKQKIFFGALKIGNEYANAKREGKISLPLRIKHKIADKLVFKKLKEKTGGNLRFFISGGAALPRALGDFFESTGIIIIEGYGLTESSPVISANRFDDYKFGTVGKPLPGIEVKIASDGEILARGPNIMQGYYKNKKETEATLIDGWLHTGDIGVFDADGFLMITDRKKHLFKTSAGKYIAPTPIENTFLASKFIDQFIVIGDRRMFLSALVVPDFEALKEYADSHKIPYASEEDLTKNDKIYTLLEQDMNQLQKKLANYERIRRFSVLHKPFTIESGEITPSLKIRRKAIESNYGELIEQMYERLEK